MNESKRSFTLDELCVLVDLPRRTVRYYIQIGLLERPEGAGRGSHYTDQHLDQLLEIRKWQEAGLSLDRIRELLGDGDKTGLVPPERPRQKGAVEVRSHMMINEGIELVIDPARANLSPEAIRELATGVMALYEKMNKGEE